MGIKLTLNVLMYITGFIVLVEELILVYVGVNIGLKVEYVVIMGTLLFFITSLITVSIGYRQGLFEEFREKKK